MSIALDKMSMNVLTYCRFGEILVSAVATHNDTVICETSPVNAVLGVNE